MDPADPVNPVAPIEPVYPVDPVDPVNPKLSDQYNPEPFDIRPCPAVPIVPFALIAFTYSVFDWKSAILNDAFEVSINGDSSGSGR